MSGRRGALGGGLLALVAIVVVVLVAGGGSGDSGGDSGLPPTAEVAKRVESLRGLRFEQVPEVRVLSQDEAEQAGEEIAGRAEAEARKEPQKLERAKRQAAASQELLALTGAIDPDSDLQGAMRTMQDAIGGVYDSHSGEVIVMEQALERAGDKAEAIVAHELTHALEDQAFGTFQQGISLLGDRLGARQSLLEGTATLAEIEYARRHLGVERPVLRILDRRQQAASEKPIPKPLLRAISFPYIEGARFAQALHSRGGWRLLNKAHRRPPTSTEQIIHPAKWRAREEPVRLPDPHGEALGEGWKLVGSAQLGELDTSVVLETGIPAGEARRAAAGWGGGRFSVWHDDGDPAPGCGPPCREDTAATLLWAWDSAAEATEFARAAERYLKRGLNGRPAAGGVWQLKSGAAALAHDGTLTALSFAPSPSRARALAAEGLQPPAAR